MLLNQKVWQRVQLGMLHMQQGLAPLVASRMQSAYGEAWADRASRSLGAGPTAALDAYGLLKTILDRWRDVFEEGLERNDRHRARSFASIALDARNVTAHASGTIADEVALRYLDAMHQLLILMKASETEITALKQLYDMQRRAGLSEIEEMPLLPSITATTVSPNHSRSEPRSGTIEQRVLAFVQTNPDLDDDQLSKLLHIEPRQSINIAARRLEGRGLLRRFVGKDGKIVNRATVDSRVGT